MTAILHDGLRLGSLRYSNALGRHVTFNGLPLNIEIEAGHSKSGVGEDGRRWERVYAIPYGEVLQTRALSDGDPVDVYVGPYAAAPMVYVVHQLRRDGSYDEDKCMLGFASQGEAIDAYKRHGPPWGFGSCDTMTFDQFRHGYLASNRVVH